MDRSGKLVKGKLVQDPVTGYWVEEKPIRKRKVSTQGLDTTFVVEAFNLGFTRAQITKCLIETERVTDSVATLYRRVDQAILDAGIRHQMENTRVILEKGNGVAKLPALLEELR